jgi:hypothetical protein
MPLHARRCIKHKSTRRLNPEHHHYLPFFKYTHYRTLFQIKVTDINICILCYPTSIQLMRKLTTSDMSFYVSSKGYNGPIFNQIKFSQQLSVYNTDTNFHLNLLDSFREAYGPTHVVTLNARFINSVQRLYNNQIYQPTRFQRCGICPVQFPFRN